ncbi:MAG: proton-conducting transporter membrane subunit [Candidatus Latescibacterota bacterium]|jgi:formate hydrogenlyase subunit 3/multisubunit Na+/H+ antiporter MnhD subunit
MSWLVGSLGVFLLGALACLGTVGRPRWTRLFGPAVTVAGALLGLVPAIRALAGGPVAAGQYPWSMPFGSLAVALDPLSALFALPILLLSALAAVFGAEYLRPEATRKELATSWFWYNLLVGSMLLVVVARNAVLFLLAWEAMSLASFFLVIFEHERESVRHAGWIYLVATHLGTAFLLVLFSLLGRQGETLDFASFSSAVLTPGMAGVLFLLALVGFGTKAGFVPLHVWLPEAHPAAPSHVSAVMSGVMIKTGIYGLLRVLTFLGPPPAWWGWTMVAVGIVSGVLGVLFALAQHDLKRLLAYHSVENVGIIALGLGVGLLGLSYGRPVVAFLGLAGGLLHVVNHAVFKGLLFLAAGAALRGAGTRELDRLGGLLRRLPVTGATFLVGSAAICGLPPLNGFVSELLVYLGALGLLAGRPHLPASAAAAGVATVGGLALIGGLAVACFCKACGVVFLGEPRYPEAAPAREGGWAMRLPLLILAGLCLAIGLGGPLLIGLLAPAVGVVAGGLLDIRPGAIWATETLGTATAAMAGLLGLAGLLALVRHRLLRARPVSETVTWDCGYAAPTARMQYTASSFAEPLTRLFGALLRTHRRASLPNGLFPASASFASETPDLYRERLYRPAFSGIDGVLARFRWLQHGRLNLYVLSVVAALLILLAWGVR